MATKLRLQRHGAKGSPFYKIVAADARAKRDGRSIEQIGTYNPTTIPATIILDVDKAVKWLECGAEPTDTVKAILSYKGAMYKKHLLRGVKLGVVKAEDVEAKFATWLETKEGKAIDHKTKADAAKKAKIDAAVNTPAKVKEVETPVADIVEETTDAVEEIKTDVVEAVEEAKVEVTEPVADVSPETAE